jgi:hypothetical protein
VDLPATERKLREAEFFFAHLRQERPPGDTRVDEPSLYYVSAFLSAARSVSLVLQAEARWGEEKYRPWYSAWEARHDAADRELLRLMNQQRRAEIHLTGASVTTTIEERPVFALRRPGAPSVSIQILFGMPEAELPLTAVVRHHVETVAGQVDLLDAGTRYLELLKELVQEFRQQKPAA